MTLVKLNRSASKKSTICLLLEDAFRVLCQKVHFVLSKNLFSTDLHLYKSLSISTSCCYCSVLINVVFFILIRNQYSTTDCSVKSYVIIVLIIKYGKSF